MQYITLTDEQMKIYVQSREPLELRDSDGRLLSKIPPFCTKADIEMAKRSMATPGPRYTTEQVQGFLNHIKEATESGELINPTRQELRERCAAFTNRPSPQSAAE